MNYQDKLGLITELEKKGILSGTLIYSFRSDCPFCFSYSSLGVILYSSKNKPRYCCAACGEIGYLNQLADNLKQIKLPDEKTIRSGGKVKKIPAGPSDGQT